MVMNIKPALLLYFIACLVFMLSVIFDSADLMLLSKPVILPSIFFYYVQENKLRFNWSYFVIILLSFIGDMIAVVEPNDFFIIIASLTLVVYLIFLKGIIDELVSIRIRRLSKMHIFTLFVCTFLLLYLLITSLGLLIETQQQNLGVLVIYGMTLVSIGVVSVLNYMIKTSRATTFMLITSLAFVISDVFFILKKYFFEIEMFSYFNNLIQVLSYYFLTRYYLLKKK